MPTLRSSVAALTVAMMSMTGAAHAGYVEFSASDGNSDPDNALATTPNSSAAEASFKSKLATNVATEDFEGQPLGEPGLGGLVLTFTSPATSTTPAITTTATLLGGLGRVVAGFDEGRYSIPSDSSSQYWAVDAAQSGDFTISFSQAISAFGFYATDVGDKGGKLTVELLKTDPASMGELSLGEFEVKYATSNFDGGALFFGLVAETKDDDFTRIRFHSTSEEIDVFGFDLFTIATRDQLKDDGPPPPPNPTPIPGTLLLAGLGLMGLGAARRRSR